MHEQNQYSYTEHDSSEVSYRDLGTFNNAIFHCRRNIVPCGIRAIKARWGFSRTVKKNSWSDKHRRNRK